VPHACAFASGPMQAGYSCHVRMTQHDVNVMCCSNSSTPHWPLQGELSSAPGSASAARTAAASAADI
jgi:hypothetical protein